MIISCGVDTCDTRRIAEMVAEHGDVFLNRTFAAEELKYASGRARGNEHLAARFAAKEAVFKALGTGWSAGISWLDVCVSIGASGEPSITLSGRAAELAAEKGIARLHVSLSHCSGYAVAMVIAEGRGA